MHIANGDGVDVPTETLGRQHLKEDCRMLPSASDWVKNFDPPAWLPWTIPAIEDLVADDMRRFGGAEAPYRDLHRWFYETRSWADSPAWLLFRHHAFAVFEAEERFSPVLGGAEGRNVPTRVVAERHVQRVLGRIPRASDFLRRIKGERWMLQATSPRKLGLN